MEVVVFKEFIEKTFLPKMNVNRVAWLKPSLFDRAAKRTVHFGTDGVVYIWKLA